MKLESTKVLAKALTDALNARKMSGRRTAIESVYYATLSTKSAGIMYQKEALFERKNYTKDGQKIRCIVVEYDPECYAMDSLVFFEDLQRVGKKALNKEKNALYFEDFVEAFFGSYEI